MNPELEIVILDCPVCSAPAHLYSRSEGERWARCGAPTCAFRHVGLPLGDWQQIAMLVAIGRNVSAIDAASERFPWAEFWTEHGAPSSKRAQGWAAGWHAPNISISIRPRQRRLADALRQLSTDITRELSRKRL